MEKYDWNSSAETSEKKEKSPDLEKAGEVIGAAVLLGVGAYAAKKFWDAKGPEIKEKFGAAGSELIDASIKKGKDELMKALGISDSDSSVADQAQGKREDFFKGADTSTRQTIREDFVDEDVIDADFTVVDDSVADHTVEQIDGMLDEEVFGVFKKIMESEHRQDLCTVYLEEAGKFGNIFSLSKSQEYMATRAAVKRFYIDKTKSGSSYGANKGEKAVSNLQSALADLLKKKK